MKRKIKIILILLTISVTLSYMSDTYSKYVMSTTNNIDVPFAKWQILVNEQDIVNNATNNLEIKPIIEKSKHIKDNTFAPSSKGYFDILINPTNVDLSFDYNITLKLKNENLPDILISKYAILDENYTEDQNISTTPIENNEIKGTLVYDNITKNFSFKPFTIRIYFEWFEGTNEQMDDLKDTQLATEALKNNTNLQIEASITFTQNLNPTNEKEINTTEN